jgi:hypothetical protein
MRYHIRVMLRGFAAVAMILAGALTGAVPKAPQATQTPQAPGQAPQQSPNGTPDGTSNRAPDSTQNAQQTPQTPPHSIHAVTVKFDYDFTRSPACSEKVKNACVEEFVAYDISAGVKNRTKLFVIPAPPGAEGVVQGITGTSPKLDFESGRHLISVSARQPDGKESKHSACTTWIVIP